MRRFSFVGCMVWYLIFHGKRICRLRRGPLQSLPTKKSTRENNNNKRAGERFVKKRTAFYDACRLPRRPRRAAKLDSVWVVTFRPLWANWTRWAATASHWNKKQINGNRSRSFDRWPCVAKMDWKRKHIVSLFFKCLNSFVGVVKNVGEKKCDRFEAPFSPVFRTTTTTSNNSMNDRCNTRTKTRWLSFRSNGLLEVHATPRGRKSKCSRNNQCSSKAFIVVIISASKQKCLLCWRS